MVLTLCYSHAFPVHCHVVVLQVWMVAFCSCGVAAPVQHVQSDDIITAAGFAGPSLLQNLTHQWTLGNTQVFYNFFILTQNKGAPCSDLQRLSELSSS
jgi:hypothetical protein